MKTPLQVLKILAALVLSLSLVSVTLAETYTYDSLGRLTGVVYDDGSTESYSYDATGNLLALVSDPVDQPPANEAPHVSIVGGNRTIVDSDGIAGEAVSFSAIATDDDGTIESMQWLINNTIAATGIAPLIILPDGDTQISFRATDNEGETSTDTVTITVQPPPLEEGWPVPYSGVTPPESLELGFNNISAFNAEDGLIYACLRIQVDGEQSNLDGIEEFDIAFEIVSLDEVRIRLVKIKPFNGSGALNEYGELPDCSGAIELTTGTYTDILLVGSDVFGIVFALYDPVNLIFQLVDLSYIGTIP